jgi:hypothetical protein
MRKILHAIAPLLCVIVLLAGCQKDDVNAGSNTPLLSGPLLSGGPPIERDYYFKMAYIDYTVSDISVVTKPQRYVATLALNGDNTDNRFASNRLDLNLENSGGYSLNRDAIKIEIRRYLSNMSTYYGQDIEGGIKLNGIKVDSGSWIAIVAADGKDVKTNKMTIIFSFITGGARFTRYVGQLVLE